jgi:hypothetical protein
LIVHLAAQAAAETSTEFILQSVVGVLSVPVVVAALGALGRLLLPTTRLSSRLRRDLAIFKDLPPSDARDEFEKYINATLALLNARYALRLIANPAVEKGEWGDLRRSVIRARRVVRVVVVIVSLVLPVLVVVTSILLIYQSSASSGQGQPSTASILLPVAIGATFTAIVLPLGIWVGNRAGRIRVGPVTLGLATAASDEATEQKSASE